MKRIKTDNLVKVKEKIDTEKLIEEIRKEPEIADIFSRLEIDEAIIARNLVTISDYLSAYKVCKECPGLEKCPNLFQHLEMDLINDHGVLERVYRPCRLMVPFTRDKSKQQLFDFPTSWFKSTLTNGEEQVDVNKNRLPFIQAALKLLQGDKGWIYLYGKPRMGKSYLAAALANELYRLDQDVIFLDMNTRVKELADTQFTDKDDFNMMLERYIAVDFLILDDFGNEYKSDYIRDTIVLPLLNARVKDKKVTIFTSEFTIEQIGMMYATSKQGTPRAEQLASLLQAMTRGEIELKGIAVY
ncbi:MAG: ATP-binding protein [Bacilli bacterium]|jgi:primosomal protein DnaI